MKTQLLRAALAIGVALTGVGPATAEDGGLVELVQILRKEGVLDEAQYSQIVTRASAQEEKRSWLDRIRLSGDLRLRYENFFFFNRNPGDEDDRHRGRYRARLNVSADINDRVKAFVRLASGDDDARSSNQTLGSGVDFDADPLMIRRAYLQVTPFAGGEIPGHEGWLGAEAGKVPNPFVWKVGKDVLFWDHDINPEGISFRARGLLNEDLELFTDGGFYVIDENSTANEVTLGAIQIGDHWQATEDLKLGSRFAWFGFFDVDPAFVGRGAALGNIAGGFDGGETSFHVVAGTLYATLDCIEDWPITLYGSAGSNLTAGPFFASGTGSEDLAWSVGLEAGDKKKFVQVGLMYAHLEANAFPAMFVDSDLFDGITNREGFVFYAARRILENTDLKLTIFRSHRISRNADPGGVSVPDANRLRTQLDVAVAF